MTERAKLLQIESPGTEVTRFNALRHGVLSRYTVLPWEDADEYRSVLEALVTEHRPQGPTEEHLVEEVAGILWRKRRLRLAEAALHRRGLNGTLSSYRETVKMALVHTGATGQSERVLEALQATSADTEQEIREVEEDEAMTRTALDLLGSLRLTLMRRRSPRSARTRGYGGRMSWLAIPTSCQKGMNPRPLTPRVCDASWRVRCSPGSRTAGRNSVTGT